MKLQFDPEPSKQYPNGYWYANSEVLGVDADGAHPHDALAALIMAAEEREEEKRGTRQ